MIHLLLALLAALTWAVWFIMQLAVELPVGVTIVLGIVSVTVVVGRRVKARRLSRELEAALAKQGEEQIRSARPDKRTEIEALQRQMREGLSALKASNVGGKRRGETAMYALPWYAIIGPPGAGKTTALRHSGLSFPHTDGAIKGVGGTRNCDWWLTNEAILLDTAGRYATEADDQAEWLEFLDLLRKHRVNKPLNGVIVAVALPDVVNATEAELEAMSKKLRSRIDEVMTRLRMTLPVYLLVTKCDLVAGFVELFGNLRKSERAQPWGATIPLDTDKSRPGGIFAREFDLMVESVHARAVARLAKERDRHARESIYQFPLELAAVKRQLEDLIGQVFAPNAFQATPMFRGFYFSSGTQDGLPLSRAIDRMRQAMGIAPQRQDQRHQLEPRSYFLHDVFTKVVFPDAEIAARSKAELRRQRFVRLSIAATAMALAAVITGPSIRSFQNNQALIGESQAIAAAASEIDWDSSEPISAKLDRLDPLLAQVKKLDQYDAGAPLSHRFLMYAGDEVHQPLIRSYVAHIHASFLRSVRLELERELLNVTGERYHAERETLKTYLMLSEVEHLDVEWATGTMTRRWAKALEPASDLGLAQLQRRLRPHVAYYLDLIEASHARAKAIPADAEIVAHARAVLAAVPAKERYESLFVRSLEHTLYDPARGHTRDNLQFPSLTLEDVFVDRPETLRVFRSRQHQRTQRYYEIPGPYTDKGHFAVLANIEEAAALLESDAWVLPLTDEERGARLPSHLDRLAEDYESAYRRHWHAFIADIDVASPTSLGEAENLYVALRGHAESPVLRILRTLEDHTQWTRGIDEVLANERGVSLVNRRVNAALSRRLRGLRLNADIRQIRGKVSTVPGEFADAVHFGVPSSGDLQKPPLNEYLLLVDTTRALVQKELTANPSASPNVIALELARARERVDKMLAPRDARTKLLLGGLLHPPFSIAADELEVGPSLR